MAATGRLADPSDLPFDESHIDYPEALTAAIDDLLTRKPHLPLASHPATSDKASRCRPSGSTSPGYSDPAQAERGTLMTTKKEEKVTETAGAMLDAIKSGS